MLSCSAGASRGPISPVQPTHTPSLAVSTPLKAVASPPGLATHSRLGEGAGCTGRRFATTTKSDVAGPPVWPLLALTPTRSPGCRSPACTDVGRRPGGSRRVRTVVHARGVPPRRRARVPDRGRRGLLVRLDHVQHCVDEREVRERLGEVPEVPCRRRVELLAVEAERAGRPDELLAVGPRPLDL